MSSVKGIQAAKAYVTFFGDDTPLGKAMKRIQANLQSFGKRMAVVGASINGLGAAAAAPMLAMAKSFAAAGNELDVLSKRTGISTESLSVLQYAAEQTGGSLGDVTGAIGSVQDKLNDAASGSLEAAMSFAKLGLSVQGLGRMKPEDRFATIADRLSKIRNPAQQAALATEIFGGSAEALLPLIKQGSAGLAQMRDRAKELGLVMDGETAKSGAALTSAFADLQNSSRSVINEIGASLAPLLTSVAKQVATIIGTVAKWVKNNRELIATIFKVALGVAAAGAVIAAIGTAIWGIGAAIGLAVTVLGAMGAALAFLLSPFGLLLAGLVAGAVYFFGFTDAGKKSIETVKGYFVDLFEGFSSVWQGITDAIAAGDLALAGKVAFLALQVAWQSVLNTARGYWNGFTTYLLDTWDVASNSIAVLMVDAFAGVRRAWLETTNFMASAWDGFSSGAISAWKTAQNFIANGIAWIIAKIEGLDPAEVQKELNDEFARNQASASKAQEQRANERAAAREAGLSQIESDRQGQRGALSDQLKQSLSGRQEANAAGTNAGEEALAKAMSELNDALDSAKKGREAVIKNAGKGLAATSTGGSVSFNPSQLKQSISGTFSGAAAGRLGGQGPMDQIARNTADTARYTRQIANQEPVKTT